MNFGSDQPLRYIQSVGRTVFWEPLAGWRAKQTSREVAVAYDALPKAVKALV